VDVTNTGKVAGKEIVQVYVHDQKSKLVRPEKELKGFTKVDLKPGETRTVSIKLDFRSFAYYHPSYGQWITEDGEVDLLIAASAVDIREKLTVTLESTVILPCLIDKESTIREWMEDPKGRQVFEPFFHQVEALSRKAFGAEEGGEDGMGADIMMMFGDMPLASILLFMQSQLPKTADDMVADLLKQVHG